MRKKIIVLAGILISITILLTLIYKFGLDEFQKGDLCDWLYSDSAYSVETWEGIQFHLPACWYIRETDEGSLSIYNYAGKNSIEELLSFDIYTMENLEETLATQNFELKNTIEVKTKEYYEYENDNLVSASIYVPTWEGANFYVRSSIKYKTNYKSFEILLGSIEN